MTSSSSSKHNMAYYGAINIYSLEKQMDTPVSVNVAQIDLFVQVIPEFIGTGHNHCCSRKYTPAMDITNQTFSVNFHCT